MPLLPEDVALYAIPLAVLVHMLLGMAWYGLLARPWMAEAHPGKTKEDLQNGPKTPYLVALAQGAVTAWLLALFLEMGAAHDQVLEALWTALLLWLAFVGATYATTYAFAGKSARLWAIDAGYMLVSMLGMAVALVYAG